MIVEYIIVEGAFGISSYFGMYKKARTESLKTLKREKDSASTSIIGFVLWSTMAGAVMPLMLPSFLFFHDRTQKAINEAIMERMVLMEND
jgi:hypothetical protein